MNRRQFLTTFSFLTVAAVSAPANPASDDSRLKTWTTAELLGAMRWAIAATPERETRARFRVAEAICYKRLRKQIDAGRIDRGLALIIAERVRKEGVYRRDPLTLAKAEELREKIVAGRIFESLTD